MKIGRNAPCWCGSGNKYKKCHLGREADDRITASEGIKVARESQRSRGCNSPEPMHIECSSDTIQSHTISKSLGLNFIAEQGHVLGLKYDLSTLKKNSGRAELGLVGINKISVFPGFCAKHDKSLFSPIEDTDFCLSREQCALLSYRSLARERYTKVSGIDINEYLKGADKGRRLIEQMAIQYFTAAYGTGLSLATNDLDHAISHHHEALLKVNYDVFESAVFQFSDEFPLLCSTGHMPSEDWGGRIIQDLANPALKADWLTAVAFHSGGSAWVVFTWLRGCELMKDFVASLSKNFEGQEADALAKYFFTISENIAVSPKWWRKLDETSKAALEARIMDGVPINGGTNVMRPRKGEPIVLKLPLLNFYSV